MYGGDFKTAVTEAQRVLNENPAYEWANLTLALSRLAQGDEPGARAAYTQLAGTGALGVSLAAMGQADLEMFYGRYGRALEILKEGIARDEKEKDSSSLGLKLVAQAEAYLARGNKAAAAAAAERATQVSDHEAVLVPAAHVLIQLGRTERALELARGLEGKIPPHIRSYAGVIKGDILLHERRIPQAIDELQAAEKLHDSWVVHTLLGQAYQAAEQYPEAQSEWELASSGAARRRTRSSPTRRPCATCRRPTTGLAARRKASAQRLPRSGQLPQVRRDQEGCGRRSARCRRAQAGRARADFSSQGSATSRRRPVSRASHRRACLEDHGGSADTRRCSRASGSVSPACGVVVPPCRR